MDSSQTGASNSDFEAKKQELMKKFYEEKELGHASLNAADIDSAIIHFGEAAKIVTEAFGTNGEETMEPMFNHGSLLLGRALLNDKFLSTMPNEQAMWFETVTGHPKPELSVQPIDLSGKSDEKKSPKQQRDDIKRSLEILKQASDICNDHLFKAIMLKCIEVAEILQNVTSDSDPVRIKANLKRAFEREFPDPDYVKKPKTDDFQLAPV